ncbi:MAG: NAD-dependent epimerase/dehydratase family protein [Terrimicrobiaceae bacterium]
MFDSFFAPDASTALEGVCGELFSGSRILITGATGAVGIHAIAALRQLASDGIEFDVYATFQSEVGGRIAELLDHSRFHVIRGDLTNSAFRSTLPETDFIFHSAGYAQPGRFLENPGKTIRLNTEATLDLLDHMPSTGRMLFVSSSEVYAGLTTDTPHRENLIGTSGPDHPRACYIEGKRCGEAGCFAAHANGLKAISARLSLAYGPGARPRDRRALYSFIENAITDQSITLIDRGEALRSYCYSADAVRMMFRILLEGKQAVYNVGGNSTLSILDVAEKIGRVLNVPVHVPEDARPLIGAPTHVTLDMSRYQNEFGPLHYIDFDAGLRRTIDWHLLNSVTKT